MSKYPTQPLLSATPSDLAWMTGIWKGSHGADTVEEYWSAFAGGAIMGMFRWQKNGAIWFYELMVIEPEDDHVVLRIKHFYPGLKGWEEKDESATFLLVQLEDEYAVFLQINRPNAPWLIYRREGDRLTSYFETDAATPTEDDQFRFTLL